VSGTPEEQCCEICVNRSRLEAAVSGPCLPEAGAVSDPSTESWRAALGQSTSAQLRQTQAALAASQADLTAAEAERDALAVLT
jgi:hypothetical protein